MAIIVKNTTIPNLFDLIAPHSCKNCGRIGSILCEKCKKYIIKNSHSPAPSDPKSPFPRLPHVKFYVLGERTGLLDDLIHIYKYDSVRTLSHTFAELLDATLPQFPQNTVIVPIPTASNHVRTRGFDHTLLLAKRLAKLRSYQVKKLLVRAQNTVQVGADKATRLRQADQAFAPAPHATANPATTYLLLDDVWTTGASVTAAIKKLRSLGAQNIIVALLAVSTFLD